MEELNIQNVLQSDKITSENEDVELTETIMHYMDNTYDTIEKSIYLYIILSDFYPTQTNMLKQYEYYLRKFNIDYKIDGSFITIEHDEYKMKVEFDAMFYGVDITCTSDSKITKQKFNEKKEIIKNNYYIKLFKECRLQEQITEYNESYATPSNITKKEKMFTILKLLTNGRLKGIDCIKYIRDVFNRIFKDDEGVHLNIATLTVDNRKYFLCNPCDEEPLRVFNNK